MMNKHKEKGLRGLLMTLIICVMSLFSVTAMAAPVSITGKVLDANGEPLIGASVVESGTSNGTVTDFDGMFTLVVEKDVLLTVSYVGYRNQEVRAAQDMVVVLREDQELLDEVVVIGYGTQKRKDVTTAISSVDTEDLEKRPITSAAQAMQGKAAGVTVVKPSGQPGAGMVVRVRGTTSMNGSNDPLYVVDGVPRTDIDFLAPDEIGTK